MFKLSLIYVALACAATLVIAHPEKQLSPGEEQAKRAFDLQARGSAIRSCGSSLRDFHEERKVKRGESPVPWPPPVIHPPYYNKIQNWTCFTTPVVPEGPYLLKNELVRQDLRENQKGVDLYLDIGVLDVHTSKPAKGFVEIWSANATGWYGGFSNSPPVTGPLPAPPPITDSWNFLRGGLPLNENGLAELVTIWPAYYTGRAPHMHVAIHQDVKYFTNGTFNSDSGYLRHEGQLYFPEHLNDAVFHTSTYLHTAMTRTLNVDDVFYPFATADGYWPFTDIKFKGRSLSDGVIGYITIAINSSATVEYWTDNYYVGAPESNNPPP